MPSTVVFIEEQPVVTIDATGVRITYTSGDATFCRRCTRAFYREYLETSLRALNAFEVSERGRVLPFDKR